MPRPCGGLPGTSAPTLKGEAKGHLRGGWNANVCKFIQNVLCMLNAQGKSSNCIILLVFILLTPSRPNCPKGAEVPASVCNQTLQSTDEGVEAQGGVSSPQGTLLRPSSLHQGLIHPTTGLVRGARVVDTEASPRCLVSEAPALIVDAGAALEPGAWAAQGNGEGFLLQIPPTGKILDGLSKQLQAQPTSLTGYLVAHGTLGLPRVMAHVGQPSFAEASSPRGGQPVWAKGPRPTSSLAGRLLGPPSPGHQDAPTRTWAGLITTVFPAARQAAVFQDSIIRG